MFELSKVARRHKDRDITVQRIPGRGRGVIACRSFRCGDLVHVAPVIVVPEDQITGVLDHYVFQWNDGHCALALGLASLMNHSKHPNTNITLRYRKQEIAFWARKPIQVGEECCHHYGYLPNNYDGR
jgi:hypothetical protein